MWCSFLHCRIYIRPGRSKKPWTPCATASSVVKDRGGKALSATQQQHPLDAWGKTPGSTRSLSQPPLLDPHTGLQHKGLQRHRGWPAFFRHLFLQSNKQILAPIWFTLCSDGHRVPKKTTAPPTLAHFHCMLLVGQT